MQILPESSGASSSHARIMHPDDENVKECQKGSCKVVFRDLEAGLPIDSISSLDEEAMHYVDLPEDCKTSGRLEATSEAVSVDAYDHLRACDVKALVYSELREPLLAHAQTDDTKSSQDKEVLLSGEKKLVGDSLQTDVEVHGLPKRRVAKSDAIRTSVIGESGLGKMPEEEQRGAISLGRTKDALTESGQDTKQKPADKKAGKLVKGTARPSAVRRVGDPQPLEELAKEEAETNRKVHESLDNFLQSMRCEPYVNFPSRPGEKSVPRFRPEVFETHAGKYGRALKVDSGSDPRDTGTENNFGVDSRASNIEGIKDASNSSAKGVGGLGRGSQHSVKVPPGVVAFTQAAAKGSDLQQWLQPSKIIATKCEKCHREFCSTLNYRRHVRVHRRSLNPEKEDLSKERSKVAAFWDKLTQEEANSIVQYESMEIEDLSGQSAFKALSDLIQQPCPPSLPQGIVKAASSLIDIVQKKASVFPLSSERLLSVLDDASEKTFLCGGTSLPVQRFVFNGEAGKVGLEEKNLVASMGFHIELKLVKAWMADKEATALRCQQALFKEEEAAQEKRAKLLEKKRMKKMRQKERKGSASQLTLPELETESVDDEGNIQGIGEEDDSPTATESSASSLASAQDLALPESAELDISEDLTQVDARDEHSLGLGEVPIPGKNTIRGEDQSHLSEDGLAQFEEERPRIASLEGTTGTSGRKESCSVMEHIGEDREVSSPIRRPDEVVEDGDADSRLTQLPAYTRSGKTGEVHSSLLFRNVDQERLGPDMKRRDSDRSAYERKSFRITKDRLKNEYPESVQKPGRDLRVFDGRHGDGVTHSNFKPVKKGNAFLAKGDGGTSDLPNTSRSQLYRTKQSGINRALPTAGNGQVVWTRKFPQPTFVEPVTDRKEDGLQDDAGSRKVVGTDGWEVEALPGVAAAVPDLAGGELDPSTDEEVDKNEDATSPGSLEDNRLVVGSSGDAISGEEIPEVDEEGVSNALLVGSLSVPLGKFAMTTSSQNRVCPHAQHRQPDNAEVSSVGMEGLVFSMEDVVKTTGPHSSTGGNDPCEPLGNCLTTAVRADDSRRQPVTSQIAKLKPHVSLPVHERGESGRSNGAVPVGQERLGAKQGSWQTSGSGRFVNNPAKVWRPRGIVGDRHDLPKLGMHVHGGDSASSLSDRPLLDGDVSGRSESEKENSPKVDASEDSPRQRDHFFRNELSTGSGDNDNQSRVVNFSTGKTGDEQSFPSAPLKSRRSVESDLDVLSEGQADSSTKEAFGNEAESAVLAFVEVAGTFFDERWTSAMAQASKEEILVIRTDSGRPECVSDETEGLNFLERVMLQLSNQSTKHCPGAESLLSQSSSVVTRSLGEPALDQVLLYRIFSDSDQTGVEDIRCHSIMGEQGLDGTGAQDSRNPQPFWSEDNGETGETFPFPVSSEQYMSGSQTGTSNIMSSAPVGMQGENRAESRGGGGELSHGRRGYKQERRYRNPRKKSPEQRYTPRAPLEKSC